MKTVNGNYNFFLRYIPYSEEDEKLGMLCTTVGEIETPSRTVYPLNKNAHPAAFREVAEGRILPEFQLVYISDGAGIFNTGDKTYTVSTGSMLLILPGMKHHYKPLYETGWHEYWVGFTGSFFDGLVTEGILSQEQIFFEIGLHDYIVSIFTRIFDEVCSQQPLFQIKACSRIFLLLADLLTGERRKVHPEYSKQQLIVEKAKELMEANIYKEIDIPSIAQKINISASHLNDVFKAYSSITPYQYYIQIKINRACRLLEQTDLTVKETAFQLGFNDQYYFSRQFKQKTGIPPSSWKKSVYK
ncbi:helix-turn-helix domain-containing protein [Leadbettera azotonutricia]|uniref:Putative transcriptional regulator n=1 Tax=Leadbettera azotonutricia (strain ATCC BAA-888 / DSM 13862 / ZAS-9) TaxID=545695 RepID=F5YES9_LEAAZ|nr:AraC family transcriptional regulator [Leadbettera azotonutricia]AEF83498.1 putative transcriptional regulator [Leadbettera azotonutricia ZAS-9]